MHDHHLEGALSKYLAGIVGCNVSMLADALSHSLAGIICINAIPFSLSPCTIISLQVVVACEFPKGNTTGTEFPRNLLGCSLIMPQPWVSQQLQALEAHLPWPHNRHPLGLSHHAQALQPFASWEEAIDPVLQILDLLLPCFEVSSVNGGIWYQHSSYSTHLLPYLGQYLPLLRAGSPHKLSKSLANRHGQIVQLLVHPLGLVRPATSGASPPAEEAACKLG